MEGLGIIWWECVYNYYCTQSRVYFGFILFFIYVKELILTHMILFNTQTKQNQRYCVMKRLMHVLYIFKISIKLEILTNLHIINIHSNLRPSKTNNITITLLLMTVYYMKLKLPSSQKVFLDSNLNWDIQVENVCKTYLLLFFIHNI